MIFPQNAAIGRGAGPNRSNRLLAFAAKTDFEHYTTERMREEQEIRKLPDRETEEVAHVFRSYGLNDDQVAPVVDAIRSDPVQWVDFMMRFELGLEQPDPARARRSAMTIAASYVVGGMVPLLSYMLFSDISIALSVSVAVTLVVLYAFGYVKGHFTGINPFRGGLQTIVTGGLAAAAAFAIARLIS